ncbi:hypothetical protein BGZ96_005275 [Linnemannia gamsii]|uniref:RanBD1 domain-containing protein n=1 Tax=Linnemannia gamsii TaxID=64522 RepID=A0ABQ7K578_9FUNG|nr:hypothetical protein BGZ96_005275 [Linnemannia gamsii]
MSKRGTDNQLTKDNYDQEDQDSGSQMGTFKMASVDELAKRPSILAKGAFTFNIGSNANALTISTPTPAPAEPLTIDREGYERSLRGVNQGFLKRIQRDLEHNATANLAGAFEAYIEHRTKVKKQYPGIEEPQTIVMPPSHGNDTSDITPVKKTFSGLGVNAVPGDATLSTSGSIPAPSTSSPFANLAGSGLFGFGSSSIKGAIDPPRNPTSSASWFNNNNSSGINGSVTSSLYSSHPFASPFAAAVTTNTPFTNSSGSPSANAFANSSSATTNKPFSFQPKPFSIGRSGSLSSGSSFGLPPSGSPSATPKPFVFQTPSNSPWAAGITTSTANATSSSSNHGGSQGDQERVADDTKSELVDSRKGEEDERTVYEVRAKLYGVENNELKDLGVGQFRVNEHTVSKKRRMIMRTGGTGLITLNSWIIQGMLPQRNKNMLTIFAIEQGKPKRFMLRVKEEQTAHELLQALEADQTA